MTTAAGRFWICPECRRHVSTRMDVCHCGFDRTKVPVQMREVSSTHVETEPERGRSTGPSRDCDATIRS